MLTYKGDFVRFNNPDIGIPLLAVWRAFDTATGLKLHPHNDKARAVKQRVAGLRFKSEDLTRQTLNAVGEWVDELPMPDADEVMTECMSSSSPSLATATAAGQAYLASARLLEAVRKLEAERRQELRRAKAAKAKADKEAAARAKVEEAREALSARLHADRCLALATLALIREVTWLNNGGAERPAAQGIANHADQLQPLARSYGYRIVKPSTVALVVKL